MLRPAPSSPTLERLVWGVLGLAAGVVIGAFAHAWLRPVAPAVATPPLPVLSAVTGFQLTNQSGQAFSPSSLRGHPWLAGIIFTRCPGPCVRVTRNLVVLQDRLPRGTDLQFVVLTADPDHDTPRVLREYGERFGADFERWHFLTGPQAAVYAVATQQLLLAVAENPEPEKAAPQDLFIHSTKVVLVDGDGKLRAVYDGEDEASGSQVLADLERLGRERQ